MQKAIAYIRVSRVAGRSGDSFQSPDQQRRAIEAWAAAQDGREIVLELVELDQSGKRDDRPKLNDALGRIRRGEADTLVAAKLDRLSRRLSFVRDLIDDAKNEKWNLVALDLGLDLTTPNGKLVAGVIGSLAEWELERRTEDWAAARDNALERNVYISAFPPFGYDRPPPGQLVPNAWRDAARELFLRRARREGLASLGRWLESIGAPTVRGGSRWTHNTVSYVLKNRAYLGEIRQGNRVVTGAHEPLLTETEWRAAQLPPRASAPKNDAHYTALTGLVFCAGCGKRMSPQVVPRPRKGGHWAYFVCQGRRASAPCPARARVSIPELEDFVTAAFERDHDGAGPLADAFDASAELQAASAQTAQILAEYQAFATASQGFDPEVIRAGLEAHQGRLQIARDHESAVRARTAHLSSLGVDLAMLAALPTLPPRQRHTLLAALFSEIRVRRARGNSEPIAARVQLVRHGEILFGHTEHDARMQLPEHV